MGNFNCWNNSEINNECERTLRAFMILTIAAVGGQTARDSVSSVPRRHTLATRGGGGSWRTINLILSILKDALRGLLVLLLRLAHLDGVHLDPEELSRQRKGVNRRRVLLPCCAASDAQHV